MYRILIIEDNADVRDNICDILGLAGYEVASSTTGKHGIAKAADWRPHLILCDVMMPDLDGYGVLKILTAREDTRQIPFVFVTAKSEQEDLRRGMNLGADDYVTKPFYKDELLRVIEVRLRKNRERERPPSPSRPSDWTGFLSPAALDTAMERLSGLGAVRQFRRGEALFREGEQVRDLFSLHNGYVKLQASTEFGKTLIMYVFSPGDLFGYPEMITRRPYEHEAVALTEVEALMLPVQAIREAMTADPNVASLLLGMLAGGILDADRRMLDQAYVSVRKRCADTLLLASRVFGTTTWPMSREELAQWSGTAKETFIRTLTDYRDAGLVTVDGARIEVIDERGLAEVPY